MRLDDLPTRTPPSVAEPGPVVRRVDRPSPQRDKVTRAEELRRKLDESRTIVEEREEFEAAETPVDEVTGPEAEVEARRKSVHERGRAAADEMRGSSPD